MKLIEIKGFKSLKYSDAEELIQKLIDQGFFTKKLGRGTYAVAFELPDGDVLKCWVKDEAYEKFIEYCSNHKGNPYLIKPKGKQRRFPLTFTNKQYGGEDAAFFQFIRLEKLEPVTSLKDWGYNDTSKRTADKFHNSLQHLAIMHGYDDDTPAPDGSDEMLKYIGLDPAKASPEFRKNVVEIGKLVAHFRHDTDMGELDLQMANFGLRGKQVVIMDPVKDEFSDSEPIPIDQVLK